MSNLITAAQQALKSLRGYRRELGCQQPCDAERALEAALEQPEQEPVAWNSVGATPLEYETECSDGARFLNVAEMPAHAVRWRMVAPPRREWQSLTEEEIQSIHDTYHKRMGPQEFARAIEAALRSKNHE